MISFEEAEVFPKISQKLFSQKLPKNSKASRAFQELEILKPSRVMFQRLFFRLLLFLTFLHHDMSYGILEKPSLTEFSGGHE
jgi:hypothetical protein